MLFAWLGFDRTWRRDDPAGSQQQTSEFLQQPYLPIHIAGPLCDDDGRRAC